MKTDEETDPDTAIEVHTMRKCTKRDQVIWERVMSDRKVKKQEREIKEKRMRGEVAA